MEVDAIFTNNGARQRSSTLLSPPQCWVQLDRPNLLNFRRGLSDWMFENYGGKAGDIFLVLSVTLPELAPPEQLDGSEPGISISDQAANKAAIHSRLNIVQ
jgi:hypothetical protein